MERWRVIEGFPDYAVSDHGRVRRETPGRKPAGTLLAVRLDSYGYPRVVLYKDGDWRKLYYRKTHVLVAEAFLGPKPTPKHEVAHGDGSRSNNRLENLRWATRRENRDDMIAHGRSRKGSLMHSAKLNEDDVLKIRASTMRVTDLALAYGVNHSTISNIRSRYRDRWAHV